MDEPQYQDEDLVYVDPKKRIVMGKVEWLANGKPKSMLMEEEVKVPEGTAVDDEDDGKRKRRRRFYPWGTYRSMKRLYKIGDWKSATDDRQITLDLAIEKAMKEPFWD